MVNTAEPSFTSFLMGWSILGCGRIWFREDNLYQYALFYDYQKLCGPSTPPCEAGGQDRGDRDH